MSHDDVQALAQEIAATEGMSIGRALEVAREQARSLEEYASEWDTWTAAWRDTRPVAVKYA